MCVAKVLQIFCLLTSVNSVFTFDDLDFEIEPKDAVVRRGRPTLLNCSVKSPKKPIIKWTRDGVYIDEHDAQRRILSNGSLWFKEVVHSRLHKPDEGVYQCQATRAGLGTVVSRRARLQVAHIAKKFTEQPQNLRLFLEDTAMFACDIEGAPNPTITWSRNEVPIDIKNSVNHILHTDGVLEVAPIMFNDLGRYRCRACVEAVDRCKRSDEVILQQNSESARFHGQPPSFVLKPKDRAALEGTTVMLYCGANGRDRHGKLPVMSWLKDGATIDMSHLDSRFSRVGKGSLRIDAVRQTDAGIYTCRADNREDSVDADAELEVQVAPRFRRRPHSKMAHVTEDVTFECDVHGWPEPKITWLKDGDIVIESDYFKLIDKKNLRILGLVRSDGGIYQCLAENSVGNIQAAAQLIVSEKEVSVTSTAGREAKGQTKVTSPTGTPSGPSALKPSEPTQVVAAIVSTRFITLSWNHPERTGGSAVEGYNVYWREKGSDRERTQNSTALETNIQHLKPRTTYEFRVQARNRNGPGPGATLTASTHSEVVVPNPPINLKAESESSTTIRVVWHRPPRDENDVLPITKYKLYYYRVGDDEEKDVDVAGVTHTLDNLNKYTEYSVRVVAFNGNGPGMSTEEVVARTHSDVPSAPPENVTLEVTGSSSITARWEPPPADARNGIITGYKVRYKWGASKRGLRNGGQESVTTDANRRDLSLTDLKRDMDYSVRVQALTVNGSGPLSKWKQAHTLLHDLDETNVPGQPTSLRVRPMSSAIVVSWTPPVQQDIMIRGYTLGYGVGIPDTYKQVLDSKQLWHTIRGLRPSLQYVISLRAFNNMGEGRPIYETVYTREQTTPEPVTPIIPPVGLKARVLSSSTIVVTWSDSTLGRNQRITDNRYYTLRYISKVGKRRTRFANATDLNVHLEDLRPNTEYEFSVKVIKGKRKSSWSLSVFNKTFEAAPSTAPRDLTPIPVEGRPNVINLSWQPPRQANGQATGYLLYYTTDATQPDSDWIVDRVMGEKLSTTIKDLTPETTFYFKVRAQNRKGYGPMSPTIIYRTPRRDGTGGGKIETPTDYGQNHDLPGSVGSNDVSTPRETRILGLPPKLLYIVIGSVVGVTLVAVIIVTAVVCRRRQQQQARNNRLGNYKASSTKKALPPYGPKDLKPPDLWINQVEHMELQKLEKSGSDVNMTVTPIMRRSQEYPGQYEEPSMPMLREEDHRDPYFSDQERYHRPVALRAKPIMIPVDQPPPREPIATAMPNGHTYLSNGELASQSQLANPVYPRTAQSQYSSAPRVNAQLDVRTPDDESDGSTQQFAPPVPPLPSAVTSTPVKGHRHHHPPHHQGACSTLERRREKARSQRKQSQSTGSLSPDSQSPVPGAGSDVSSGRGGAQTPPVNSSSPGHKQQQDGHRSLPHRGSHPLKSFSLAAASAGSNNTSFSLHLAKSANSSSASHSSPTPQQQQLQQQSPYKKPTAQPPPQSRSPKPIVSPKVPDVSVRSSSGGSDTNDSDLPKSYSQEELSAEMANLEGLMKDLNAITQQEFEC